MGAGRSGRVSAIGGPMTKWAELRECLAKGAIFLPNLLFIYIIKESEKKVNGRCIFLVPRKNQVFC
ncbi:MAG TPA: hypothetical protein DCP22_00585 [Ruminococcaceae bacterium]|nr:hypothetical protein [Oscillospiraceae bacterium]